MEGSRSETSAAEENEEIIYTSVRFSQTPLPRTSAAREKKGKEAAWGRSTKDFILSKSKIYTPSWPPILSACLWCSCFGSKTTMSILMWQKPMDQSPSIVFPPFLCQSPFGGYSRMFNLGILFSKKGLQFWSCLLVSKKRLSSIVLWRAGKMWVQIN